MGAFDGIRIIDFTQFMAGPLATQLLADMGAEVIKIERPGQGEASRGRSASPFTIDGERNAFVALNRNKKSVVLDLKDTLGCSVAKKLCSCADVVIENFRPGVMDRLGLGYDTLGTKNPRLIYCAITGFGDDPSLAADPGQDLLVQSLTGFARMNGRAGDPPIPAGPSVVDASTGHLAALAVASALYERERSGLGQRVTTSLVAASLSLQSQEATLYVNSGEVPKRSTSGVSNPIFGAPYGIYQTEDGYLALAHTSLPKLGQVLEVTELDQFGNPDAAYAARDRVYEILAKIFVSRKTLEWLAILRREDFWVAPVQDYKEFFSKLGNGHVEELRRVDGTSVRLITPPITFSRTPATIRTAPPTLGEHTQEELDGLELFDDQTLHLSS